MIYIIYRMHATHSWCSVRCVRCLFVVPFSFPIFRMESSMMIPFFAKAPFPWGQLSSRVDATKRLEGESGFLVVTTSYLLRCEMTEKIF